MSEIKAWQDLSSDQQSAYALRMRQQVLKYGHEIKPPQNDIKGMSSNYLGFFVISRADVLVDIEDNVAFGDSDAANAIEYRQGYLRKREHNTISLVEVADLDEYRRDPISAKKRITGGLGYRQQADDLGCFFLAGQGTGFRELVSLSDVRDLNSFLNVTGALLRPEPDIEVPDLEEIISIRIHPQLRLFDE